MKENNNNLAKTFLFSLIITIIFIPLITIVADLVLPIKKWLAESFGHHWVGKSILSVTLFVITTFISYPYIKRSQKELSSRFIYVAGYSAVVATLAIIVFYIYEFLIH